MPGSASDRTHRQTMTPDPRHGPLPGSRGACVDRSVRCIGVDRSVRRVEIDRGVRRLGAAWLATLALAANGAETPAATSTPPLVLPEGYTLVWSDDFTEPGAPDPAK